MAVTVRTVRPVDRMAQTQRTRLWLRVVGGLVVCIACGVGLWWLVARAPWMRVSEIQVQGGNEGLERQVRTITQEYIDSSWLGVRGLTPILDTEDLASAIASRSDVATVSVAKRYWHTVQIEITSRTPVGLWCVSGECQFVDEAGTRWGVAPLSRGPLLLLVEDERAERGREGEIWSGIRKAQSMLGELGLTVIRARVLAESAMHVELVIDKSYTLKLDMSQSVEDQVRTLESYLSSRPDLSMATYLDLRTSQRVYVGKTPKTEE